MLGLLLPLPLTPDQALGLLDQALGMLPPQMDSPEACVIVLAIALQETGLRSRWQVVDPLKPLQMGPARGLAQFEKMGGCAEVVTNPAVATLTRGLCRLRGWSPTIEGVFEAIVFDDVLALGLARLLLWIQPQALPELGEEETAWRYYLRAWKPGRPHRERWAQNYPLALRTVRQAEA